MMAAGSNDKVKPELTLVLLGDTSTIDVGSKNLLVDHEDQTHVVKLSSKLYDLCGRQISVINMLGLPNIDQIPLNEPVHAFLLLISNGLHNRQYRSGVQWLEKAAGKESLSYMMTVVTHEPDSTCESVLTELKGQSTFTEKRYHTCTRSMMDEAEIITLLEKIDVMVTENNPSCYRLMCDENEEQQEDLDHKSHKEEDAETGEEMVAEAKLKCDSTNEPGGAGDSEKTDDSTGGELENRSEPSEAKEKDCPAAEEMENKSEIKEQRDSMKEPGSDENSEKTDDSTGGQSETTSERCEAKDKGEEMVAEAKLKCDSMKEPGGAEDSEKTDDSTGGEPETRSEPSEAKEKDCSAAEEVENKSEIKEQRDSMKEPGSDENSEKTDDSTGGQSETTSERCEAKDKGEEMVAEAKLKCDSTKEPGGAEDSEKTDDSTGGEPETRSEPSEAKEKDCSAAEEMENQSEIKEQRDSMKEPGSDENSEKTDDSTGGQSETTSEQCEAKDKGSLDRHVSGHKEKQSLNVSEENRETGRQREMETLLSKLHLQEQYQQKMSPADFLKITPPMKQSHDTSEKDIAHTFLHRLMGLDYRARYIPVRRESPDAAISQSNQEFDDTDDFDALFSTTAASDQFEQNDVHPLDVQMAVFHCSDSFLKQQMITKLSQCQYALPLLVPDPLVKELTCPLWTFRQIMKTWKIILNQDDPKSVTTNSMPIYKAQIPMVSCFRLGSLSLSKSQLMNSLINDRHSTFFHRNCPGSTKTHHLMDGVAEIAWYCPAGKPEDSFTDCTAFCNLHGDALLNEKQREILTEKSAVNVVFVPTLERNNKSAAVITELYKSTKPLIILIAGDDCDAVQVKPGKYKLGLRERTQPDVSGKLKGILRKILSGPHSSFQLESMAEVSGIRVDEDDSVCQKGKEAAMKISNLLQGMDISKIKDRFLPCQGQLWHEWSRIKKELYHLRGNIEKEKSQKQQQLEEIRQKQRTASCSDLMKSFTESLLSLSSEEKEYFLKWTQIFIDDLSTDDLSSILQSYDETWSEVLDLKNKHNKSDELMKKQKDLEKISKKLQSATFGLEHIFREMGQIFEAQKSEGRQTTSRQSDWSKYPELAADLMISGHMMELMDGDAGHVPLTWISSLLDEVIKKLGDQRVFVLSVLGVQSSGKSTMLNAMFGLQFAVSAGRCTRGAFMQLVKVSEEIQKDFKFDYILVVDTEGLRALELAGNTTLHHDNELATFVVGLGNLTLINIFGENPAEMQDVLQVIVQAFMRMKKVKLSPSCVFVHQNVTDITAAEKNMEGKRRLQEKLDQMAKLAAKEEACDAECFSDIIKFDVQTDVKYFAQLWEGSPPMAPPNPGYSESVQELKNIILSKASQSDGIPLSHSKSKIQDLWNALMNEHFVFSFKNTLEIVTYRKLEVQYGNWTWTLRSHMLTVENQLHTSIENGKQERVDLSDLYQEMRETYENIKTDMTKYFEENSEKEILVQWRGRFETKINEFHEELVKEVKRKLDEVIEQKNACKKMDEKKTEFENKLLQKSKELAHQLKDKANDEEELKKQFDAVWSQWVTELTGNTKPIRDINLKEDQMSIIQRHGIEWSLIDESKSSSKYTKISCVGDYADYIIHKKHTNVVKAAISRVVQTVTGSNRSLQFEDQEQIRSLINDVGKKCIVDIKTKPVATRGYSPAYLEEVAKKVQEKVTEFESERNYTFKKEFRVDLILYVFDRAESFLSQSHMTYKKNNDALTYLNSKKTEYYNIFRSFCKGNSSAVVFGEMICEKLRVSSIEAVCNKTAIDVAKEMKCSFPAFSGNRLDLEKHVLKSLAEKEDFKAFISYIYHPKNYMETFIKEEVEKYILREHKGKVLDILKKNVDDKSELISRALFTATEKVKTQKGGTDIWVEEFSTLLKENLTLGTISCQNFRDIEKFDFLKEEIEKGLKPIMEEVSHLSLTKLKDFRQSPDQILINQLCNCCWETCPFCGAVCTNTLKDHSSDDHSVPFHRSASVRGCYYKDTDILSVEFCTTDVVSDLSFYPVHDPKNCVPFKKYRTAGGRYANWRITPDESKLKYWTWFVCRFQTELEEFHGCKFKSYGEIPSEWRKHTKEEAIQSLDEM
ncbi:interferon-induced very large GTPase 1-like isoform X2 [Parambassis ranga]|uniref:Interferon-induced very large GTPase 1-like isoform X2 n=1 Tax=Parambassis ranga TaxID=210632 RepID=A0A6P7INS8_9TELE|nr:interferon-induced very large GTPase 1-like isoform X2 [Parambassis ranga]